MNFKILFVFAITIAVATAYKSYSNHRVHKLEIKSVEDVRIVKELEESGRWYFWNDRIEIGGDVRIMVAPQQEPELRKYLTSVNIKSEVLIEDVQKLIDEQLKRPHSTSRNVEDYAWTYYQTMGEIDAWLDHIVAKHSDVASIITLGRSVEGRDIRGVKIDYQKLSDPVIGVIESGIHAREWIAPATATWIIKEFLESTDPDVRFMAETVVWHIFPVFNPDGYDYTFTHNRMWRKNRQTANHTSCAHWNADDDFSNGIDLNRNFGYEWMTIGASQDACTEIYAGPAAYSEPESAGMVNYVTALQNEGNVVYYLAFHSYSQMVLVPYSNVGGADVLTVPNYADLYEIAIKGMDKLTAVHGTAYTVGTSIDILYAVGGSSVDWAKGIAQIPIVFLFELRDIGPYGFLLPAEQIIPNNEEIMASLVEMDKTARQLGYVTHSDNSAARLGFSVLVTSMLGVLLAM